MVNSVLVFDGKNQSGIGLITEVRKQNYNLVIDLFGNPRSALVTYFSRAKYRVGYNFGWRKYCYNIIVTPRGGEVHNTQFNLDAIRACDLPVVEPKIHLPVPQEAEQFAEQFYSDQKLQDKTIVALNPAGGWYTKRWGIPKYAQLGDAIAKHYKATILLLWGPGERDEVERIAAMMTHPVVIAPPTSLQQLAAVLKRCSFLITNDSGPMHIAASVGTPTVAIFGPTNPMLQGPYGNESEIIRNERLGCLSCNFTACPIGNPCMEELTVEEVFKAFERLERRMYILRHPDLQNT